MAEASSAQLSEALTYFPGCRLLILPSQPKPGCRPAYAMCFTAMMVASMVATNFSWPFFSCDLGA
jgi:hypothetical protein